MPVFLLIPLLCATTVRTDVDVLTVTSLPHGIARHEPSPAFIVAAEAVVYISGAIKHAGAYAMSEDMTVGDLIAAAGGVVEDRASGAIELHRRVDGKVVTQRVTRETRLEPHDTVLVLRAARRDTSSHGSRRLRSPTGGARRTGGRRQQRRRLERHGRRRLHGPRDVRSGFGFVGGAKNLTKPYISCVSKEQEFTPVRTPARRAPRRGARPCSAGL
jgi:hypothetical protein